MRSYGADIRLLQARELKAVVRHFGLAQTPVSRAPYAIVSNFKCKRQSAQSSPVLRHDPSCSHSHGE